MKNLFHTSRSGAKVPSMDFYLEQVLEMFYRLGIVDSMAYQIEWIAPEACDFGLARKYILDGAEYSCVFARIGRTIYVVIDTITYREEEKNVI